MTGNESPKIGGLLLAAGGSSRLGQPKQLLRFGGKTLIRRAAETLVGSVCDPCVVVLGAEIDRSTAEIADLDVGICINEEWQTGMSSSIKAGLHELLSIEPGLAAVVITLCDQPNVVSADLDRLAAGFRSSDFSIVAAEYGGTIGVPALFTSDIFNELSQLDGDKGARQKIRRRPDSVRTVAIDNAAFDVDTPDDARQV